MVIQLSPQTQRDDFPVQTGLSHRTGNQGSEFAKLFDNFTQPFGPQSVGPQTFGPQTFGPQTFGLSSPPTGRPGPDPYGTDSRPPVPEYRPDYKTETPQAKDPSGPSAGKTQDDTERGDRPAEAAETQKPDETTVKNAKPKAPEDEQEKIPGFEDGVLAFAGAAAVHPEAAESAPDLALQAELADQGAVDGDGAADEAAVTAVDALADDTFAETGVEADFLPNKKSSQKLASGEAATEEPSSGEEARPVQPTAFDDTPAHVAAEKPGAAGRSAGEAETGPEALKKAATAADTRSANADSANADSANAGSANAGRAGEAAAAVRLAGKKVPGTEKEEPGGPEKSRDRRKERLSVEVRDHRTHRPLAVEVSRSVGGDTNRDAGSGFGRGGETEIIVELPSQAHSRAETAAGKETRPAMGFQDMLARELHQNLNGDIVRHASIMLRDGGEGTIRMTLKPEALGNVKIRLEMTDNKIAGHIIVESKEALRAFEQEIRSLEQAFRDSGFDGATLEMAVASDGGQDGAGRQWEGGEASPFFSERLAASNYEAAVTGINDEEYLWLSGGSGGEGRAQINMLA
ncbi:hypothetical protein AGMMS50267_07160 [Spirochaetia bacterium]|nr:hypothetical protein AGMMS50267_07160 [Spirochaetia bacterium]